MKKTVLSSILVGVLCALVLSCASTGGSGGAASPAAVTGEVFAGNWEWETQDDSGDGGSSTITMVVAEEVIDGKTVTTRTFSGEITAQFEYGYAQCDVTPEDDATLAKLRAARAISFKMLGDGNEYKLQLPTPAVTDWAYHQRTLRTTAGEVQEIELILRTFTQPGWGAMKRLNMDTVEGFVFATFGADEKLGSFSFKVWDFELHL